MIVLPFWMILTVFILASVAALSVFLGLPLAAIKFIFTGRSGIKWFLESRKSPFNLFFERWPILMWHDD